MDEAFDLPVTYKGEDLLFPSKLVQLGYTHRFIVNIDELEVAFEPDEERNYRAIIDPNLMNHTHKVTIPLLEAIANAIETVIK